MSADNRRALSLEEVESHFALRQDRLDKVDPEKIKSKKALIPRFKDLPTNEPSLKHQDAFDRIEVDRELGGVSDVLPRMVVSNLDELIERQRLLRYDKLWQRAEEAFTKKKLNVQEQSRAEIYGQSER